MSKEFTYTFIIPHKNCPKLLQRCVNSIPISEDIEVIIIDDNSDVDMKPSIDREDTDLILLDADHSKGAGRARNVGLELAKGKWLIFADADDFFTDNLTYILNKYKNDDETDMVLLNAQMVDGNGTCYKLRYSMYIENYLKKRFYSEKVLRYGVWTPWSRMVKRELIKQYNIRFEEVPTGNDMMFCLNCSRYANKLIAERCIVYNYLQPTGRSLTNAYSKKISSIEPKVERLFRMYKLYQEVGYFFKPDHIRARYNARKTDKAHLVYYNALLRRHKYSNIEDFCHFMFNELGRLFKII